MANLSAIRQGLAVLLATIPGLRVSPIYTAQINPPAAIIMPVPGQIWRLDTFEGGASYFLRVHILVSYVQDSSSQAQLDGYLAGEGPLSIPFTMRQNPTLNGTCEYAILEGIRGYGLTEWAGQEYLGVIVGVTVMAT